MSFADRLRAKAHAAIDKLPGKLGEVAKKANDALGRPLADEHELQDRRAFTAKSTGGAVVVASPAAAPVTSEAAPVIVYYMEKQKREVSKLTDVLDSQGIKYTVTNIQEDPAAQFAVRRDSKGMRLPVCFIAGECVGGKVELVNLVSSGELKKKVFGS
jgi:glutaredoxin-related protein